jgi:hypothetical protein
MRDKVGGHVQKRIIYSKTNDIAIMTITKKIAAGLKKIDHSAFE